MTFLAFLIFVCWLLAIVAVLMIVRHVLIIRKAHDRLSDSSKIYTESELLEYSADESSELRGWLYRAGFRSAQSPVLFIIALIGSVALGIAMASGFITLGFRDILLTRLENMPGGAGDIFIVLVLILPIILFVVFAVLPIFVVVKSRQRRVERIKSGMPIILELLATLSASGLTLDSAIDRILASYRSDHPLAIELQIYQADLRSGRSRVECLRRMGRRVDVVEFTAFISAIVLAEQRGASITEALRSQAEELRKRRRERALEMALTAPVKRIIPMIVFFLPAIFVVTLGPIYFQFFQVLDGMLQQRLLP